MNEKKALLILLKNLRTFQSILTVLLLLKGGSNFTKMIQL